MDKKILDSLKIYLSNNYLPSEMTVDDNVSILKRSTKSEECLNMSFIANDISGWIDDRFNKNYFLELLFSEINNKGLSDVEVYKRAGIDRKLFSKLKRPDYHPSKRTVFALIIALELNHQRAKTLLKASGYSFSKQELLDCIIEFFIIKQIYDFEVIDDALCHYDIACLKSKE